MSRLYQFIRPLLFQLSAETAHEATLKGLRVAHKLGLLKFCRMPDYKPRVIMGIEFPNPVGLAAGLDKNGEYIDALARLGFGFIEVGTITPRAQAGNPRPRLFRLVKDQAIINRMGFNNKGVDYLIASLKKTQYQGVLGINIGKNADTPLENAVDDYLLVMKKVYTYASYVVINLSSPNTPGLRELQHGELLRQLLLTLKQAQNTLTNEYHKYVPLVVKIAPDLTETQLMETAFILKECEVDGIIATNTTLARDHLQETSMQDEKGGLSGQPLFEKSTQVLAGLQTILKGRIPMIAVGGILSASDANKKFAVGAHLIQLYTGLIYEGPGLIKRILKVLATP